MALKEIVIGQHADPDFGVLTLIETRTAAALNGGPRRPSVFRQWTGKVVELGATLDIASGECPPVIAREVRADFLNVLSDPSGFIQRIARSELELAKDWAAETRMDFPLDELGFARVLKITAFTISPERLTVWIEETANIFGGHQLEVRIEMGEIIEICLAG
jgi:hypothetical protein